MGTDFQRREFADGEELAQGLADWTAERLREGVAARGVGLLIVSGGKSPARFFDLLSNLDLEWSRVAITLADERRVADDSPRSNARLVRERLLRNRARSRKLYPACGCPIARGPGACRSKRAHRQSADACGRRDSRAWVTMGTPLRGSPAPKDSPKRWTRGLGSLSLQSLRRMRPSRALPSLDE